MPGLFPGIHFSWKERIEMEQKRNAKGEGSFKINKDGTVTHRKSLGYKANGHRKILTVTAANKTACIREMKKKESQWEKQKNAEQIMGGTTVVELCYLHLKYQTEQKELRPKSIDRRECTIDRHIDGYTLGRMQVQAVKVADIDKHITELIREEKLSASSIEKVVDVLNAAYNWAMVRGELEKMLALRWRDVDFEHGFQTIEKSRSVAKNRDSNADKKYVIVEGPTKNVKARKIKLKKEAIDILRLIKIHAVNTGGQDDLIVTTNTGQPNTATNLEHRMVTIFKNAGLSGLSGGLHIFRRTFATRMYENGARVKEIAAYIGDLESTTERYYIAVRKKITTEEGVQQIVDLPVRL